jgi:hypothetical protein
VTHAKKWPYSILVGPTGTAAFLPRPAILNLHFNEGGLVVDVEDKLVLSRQVHVVHAGHLLETSRRCRIWPNERGRFSIPF